VIFIIIICQRLSLRISILKIGNKCNVSELKTGDYAYMIFYHNDGSLIILDNEYIVSKHGFNTIFKRDGIQWFYNPITNTVDGTPIESITFYRKGYKNKFNTLTIKESKQRRKIKMAKKKYILQTNIVSDSSSEHLQLK